IMTKDFDIEVETGLKHDIRRLENKLANTTKETYVVVPSGVGKDKYKTNSNIKQTNIIPLNEAAGTF
ncbi:MAG: hypothetical protein ACP5U0_09495, partial [Caldisphaera sp.]